MKTIFRTIIVVIAVIMAASCHQYTSIEELTFIADELEQNSSSYTVDDWQVIIEQYESVITSMEEYEFTNEELQEIGKQQGRCLGYLTKGYAIIAAKKGSGYINQLKGIIDGLQESLGDGSDVYDSLHSLIDSLY